MWEPSAPTSGSQSLSSSDAQNYSVHIAALKNGGISGPKEHFLLCKSTVRRRDSVSDSEDDETIKSGCFGNRKSSNALVMDLRVKKANILLETPSSVRIITALLALHVDGFYCLLFSSVFVN